MNGGGAGPGPVWLAVSSSLNAFRACKRFSPSLTIAELKCKLELVVGSPASCMDLELFGAEDEALGPLDCDEALLGSYPVTDGCRIHVTDRSGARAGQFEDLSQVAKYEMAESDYDKRTESVRSFLRQRSWGRWDREREQEREREREQRRAQECPCPQSVTVTDVPCPCPQSRCARSCGSVPGAGGTGSGSRSGSGSGSSAALRRRRRPRRCRSGLAARFGSRASPAAGAPSPSWVRRISSRGFGWG
ncbi:tubulin-folding cofactor B isoform X6 [Catharus ustulatus]|uniref:tubulin-folding cofactor B isoform X1 n=1 Tax=Catharus ustulatus TaxID=91951 RepID=UPI0014098926|nr:tubulin-folding cofactor B isoform X1 [Catharus ustulatus]XP_032939830.1 tubulin-folding cofactor B isoform X2 [Catharus ustulatus]XP_032939833.1 tubulin-folding cofactor B isoform X5 [Catharus ustulatus]XP_032939834.1 tubulin-folding cofactor B isoform X6 [Catharus ustulatus]